ncbi:MAG: lysophospholipid acyltransferase family protein [Candidatus Omnitrophica bacterium]|nr:lysophospholipid acyltransferase family protein [Candidatus Omnitrophota bacterium]
MDYKKINKSIGRFAGWFGLIICSLIIKLIPKPGLYAFAEGIAAFGYLVAIKQRRIASESLKLAFGKEKSKDEITRIAKDCFRSMAKSAIEVMFLIDKPALLKKQVSLVNQQFLDQALAKGKGVVLVSAHFGNFPLLLARLSQDGYRVAGIMRPMRDLRVEKIFVEKREKYNVRTIYSTPRNTCVNQTIETLRRNELVFIPIDQNFGTAGVFVDFFGRKAATATGPVIFAQRTKASLVPCFIVRQEDNTQKIIFEPEIDLEEGKTSQETIEINIQKLTRVIEAYIRKYPAEWGWVHRRWKTKKEG